MHTTVPVCPQPLTPSAVPPFARLRRGAWVTMGRLWQQFKQQQRAQDEARALGELSDRTLHDLGLAERAPPWRVDKYHWELDRWTR